MQRAVNAAVIKAALESANLDLNAAVRHDVLKGIFTGTGMSGDHFEDLYRVAVPSYAQFLDCVCHSSPCHGGIVCSQDNNKTLSAQEQHLQTRSDQDRVGWAPRVEETIERRGLEGLLVKINHLSLVVSDAHRSLEFYRDVLGCKLINRPSWNFPGAWLWMGNVQLHLVQNKEFAAIESAHAACPGTDVNHMSFEVHDVAAVEAKLKKLQIHYEKYRVQGHEEMIQQLFLADPDGHYVEICDCGKQTDVVLGPLTSVIKGGA